MELTPLRYFVTVARELHFRRAAAKLNLTQAPLSAAVKKLEDELGCKLFKRTSRVVELTEAGKMFLTEAEGILNRAEQAQKRLSEFLTGKAEQLSIGYNEPAIHSFLPRILSLVRMQEPALRLQLRELETAEQYDLLKKGTIDIGFLRPFNTKIDGLTTRLIFREKYVLVVLKDHELSRKKHLTIRDLAGKDIILFARDVNPEIYDQLIIALTVEGMKPPRFRQDARNKSSMLAMVQAGFGSALVPESCCKGATENVIIREIESELPSVEIAAVWAQENTSEALRRFIRFLPEPEF